MNRPAEIRYDLLAEHVAPAPRTANRLLLRNYVRETEIGAFDEERGIDQTLRFNLTVETLPPEHPAGDDVDDILSYDTLVQVIDAVLGEERLDLLETLAERIADRLLAQPMITHVTLCVEKLDRGPFQLGVEIERTKPQGEAPASARRSSGTGTPIVVMVSDRAAEDPRLGQWFDQFLSLGQPVILTTAPGTVSVHAETRPAQRQIDLLAMEQAAWKLAARDTRCCVVESQTELQYAMEKAFLAVWAPSRIVRRARDASVRDDMRGPALTAWFARQVGAELIYGLGTGDALGTPLALVDHLVL
ncbi:dihydroneopterin aldolase [Chachezhania antarctica]|uniref:dihydroneopterin aldolase n=1 Tax=Chachezhania antarctica TaxID=2340860 RepID=UPI000EAF0702|nr:dihydroneopterin aldolase [Chachezhania antarctica]